MDSSPFAAEQQAHNQSAIESPVSFSDSYKPSTKFKIACTRTQPDLTEYTFILP